MHHGQEIYTFFNRYGIYGLIGLLLSMFLIVIIIYKVFKIILQDNKNNVDTYQKFLTDIMPTRFKKNKILIYTINNIINIFLLISFNIMVAGFSTYFFQELNLPKLLGSILIAVITFIAFSKSINGVIKINTYLIPIIIILILFLGIKKIELTEIKTLINNKSLYWIISSILYASYNSITLIPILVSLKKQINTKKNAKLIASLTFIIMSMLSITLYLLINTFFKEIKNIEIPIIYIANTLGGFAKYIYGMIILAAIFTTAVSTGYSFLNNVTKSRKKYTGLAAVICFVSIFIGLIGFSNLINILYPIFGYLGIIQIIFLLIA